MMTKSASAGQHTADGGGEPEATILGRKELLDRLFLGCESGRKQTSVVRWFITVQFPDPAPRAIGRWDYGRAGRPGRTLRRRGT